MNKEKLNSFDAKKRQAELEVVVNEVNDGTIIIKPETDSHNMHCHTTFSYNAYDFSPSYIAYLAKKENWFAAGIVDFDVLDGVEEFLNASEKLNIRGVCGLETRAYLPEFSDREINSPGEPGITYHMGIGYTTTDIPKKAKDFLNNLKKSSQMRTKDMVDKVNEFLSPVELDFEKDAMGLTPGGNATERHVCEAYENKAKDMFQNQDDLVKFWTDKLGLASETAQSIVADSGKIQGMIRSKTMKSGGVGYVKPTEKTFPYVKDVNDFTILAGGIPTITWLNGLSSGEKCSDELLDLNIKLGAGVLNIVPDRNWNISDADDKAAKLAELAKIVEQCKKRDIPIIVGTEMNAPGLKLVDSFESEELSPYTQIFKEGAALVYAHTLMQPKEKGYLSKWADDKFKNKEEKNKFFISIGLKNPNDAKAEIKKL